MSVKDDAINVIVTAKRELSKLEGLAVNEVNRVEAGLDHALSAASSMVLPEPAPEPEPDPVDEPAKVTEVKVGLDSDALSRAVASSVKKA